MSSRSKKRERYLREQFGVQRVTAKDFDTLTAMRRQMEQMDATIAGIRARFGLGER